MKTIVKNPVTIGRGKTKAGFTLTEVAIVLGVIGIILGAIWGVAASMFENNGVASIMQEISKSVGNIRDAYSATNAWPTSGTCQGSNSWGAVGSTNLTACFDGKNLLPVEMRSTGGTYIHGLGGSFSIWDETYTIANTFPTFRFKFLSLKPSACVKLLSQISFNDPAFGIVQLFVNNTTTAVDRVTSYSGGLPVWTPALPFTNTTASGWCNLSGNNNEIDIDFRLRD